MFKITPLKPPTTSRPKFRDRKMRQAGLILFITTLVLIVPNLSRFVN